MGKRGPSPTPANLVALRGNPGKRAINRNEPKPSSARITIPKHLDPDAKAAWKRLAPELKKLGLLTIVDVPLLSMLCTELATYWKACAEIESEGATQPSRSYVRLSPYVGIRHQARAAIISLSDRFGMSPSARTSLSIQGEQTMGSKLLDLMARGKHGARPAHPEDHSRKPE